MTNIETMKPECRGSWSLSSACGRCDRCEATRPSKNMQSGACELLGELRVIARDCPHVYHVLRAGEHFGLSAEQTALQAAIFMQRRAKEMEARTLEFLNTSAAPFGVIGDKS